jgi:shikimate dehydrogenase
LAVLGSPVAHSLSPAMHRAGFAAAGLRWSYERIECDGPGLPGVVDGAGPGWVGFSVTMPGKAAAAAYAADRSERVARLGVANTLVRRASGWFAENTDVDGVLQALRVAEVPVGGPALVLGGGGTAVAVLAGLAERDPGGSALLAGRRPESTAGAVDLARRLGLRAATVGWSVGEISAAAADVTLVVSTVPAGAADPFAEALAGVPALFDVVYHPWPTPLAAAGRPGRITVTGLDLLLHQGLRQFELFTALPAPAAAMRSALRAAAGTDLPLPLQTPGLRGSTGATRLKSATPVPPAPKPRN